MDLAIVSATPFALAVIAPAVGGRFRRSALAWILAAAVGALFGVFVSWLPIISQSGPLTAELPWVPQLGLSLSLYLDGLSLFFALLITGIGALIILYAGAYFHDIGKLTRFYGLLLAFMGGMLGLVMAGNIVVLFICWEITSIASFFLISFKGNSAEARAGALQALIITGGGGLALLAGLALLGGAAGSMELATILSSGEALRAHPWYVAICLLIFAGCFTKSAQFPLHFWLPDAMHAPTPASAYLHSATMVKAGIYLLARMYPVLGDTALWQVALTAVGLATLFIGAFFALRQRDLKACLAYATISQLGALVALVGLPHGEGLKAALIGVLAHALYKGALFLVVGAIDHATGTRDLRRLGGLARAMPGLAVIAVIAGLSMAGLPPLLGFVAKEALLESLIHSVQSSPLPLLPLAVVMVSAAFNVTLALILTWDVFFARPRRANAHQHTHRHAPAMLVGPGMLAGVSVIGGLGLESLVAPLIEPILTEKSALHLFSGFNLPFILSLGAVIGGAAVFAMRQTWRGWRSHTLPTGPQLFRGAIRLVEWAADGVLRTQHGKLRHYLAVILVSVCLLMLTAGLTHVNLGALSVQITSSADLLKVVLLISSLAATFASILFKRHLLAALALGVAGYAVGGLFLLEPAPDVALVQFLVETLGTVLIITMLGKISSTARRRTAEIVWRQSRSGLLRDGLIATAIGVGVGLFALAAVTHRPQRDTVTRWHLENALTQVGATDVVAAIVTDFRGMDTVIEITVFGLAALGVLTLLTRPEPGKVWRLNVPRVARMWRRISPGPETQAQSVHAGHRADHPHPDGEAHVETRETQAAMHEQRTASKLDTPLTRKVAALILPFALLISLSHLLYSGVAPGDGFTAGAVSGIAVALWYVVYGYEEARRRLKWLHPARLIGLGISLAVLNAALPLLFGQPFLVTTQVRGLDLPAHIHLTSTMIFETGIFLAVLGGASTILETIAHPRDVEQL